MRFAASLAALAAFEIWSHETGVAPFVAGALLPEEQAALRDAVSSLVNITDEALRKSVAQRMIRDRKLRRWRLEHGWRLRMRAGAFPSGLTRLGHSN